MPVPQGPTSVVFQSTMPYNIPPQPGSTIIWQVIGGSIQNGQGTDTINVYWNQIGPGSVNVAVAIAGQEEQPYEGIIVVVEPDQD